MRKALISCLLFCVMTTVRAQYGEYVGGDISLIPEYEASKTKYFDASGNVIPDLVKWFVEDCGWNTFRVRLFVNPKERENSKTGVVQNLDYVTRLGKRIKDAGGLFCLDFHYSDSWADPEHQEIPGAWKSCTTAGQKAEKIYSYTKETLQHLKASGACPDLVQVGNEISYGMVGINVKPYDHAGDDWDGMVEVLTKGCKAVREVCPSAKIIIHTERSGKADNTEYFYRKISAVDYDIIGLSYYPFYHGTLSSLKATLGRIKSVFPGKEVHIVETAYPIQWWPGDAKVDTRNTWPVREGSCDGQYKFTKDLLETLKGYDNVKGLSWWFPEEAGNGDNANWNTNEGVVISTWLNRGLWWPTIGDGGHWPLTSEGSGVLWQLRSFLNPAASIDNISAEESLGDSKIYNIHGQFVGEDIRLLPKGLYIKKNKKILR